MFRDLKLIDQDPEIIEAIQTLATLTQRYGEGQAGDDGTRKTRSTAPQGPGLRRSA